MARTVIWTGPVGANQVPDATLPGAARAFLTCRGDDKPSCAQIADAMVGEGGRRLPNFLRKVHVDPAATDLYLAAFSAGGQILKRLALHEADRAQMRAMVLSDATYSDWLIPNKMASPPEGFVRFALDALSGEKLFLATASAGPNPTPKGILPSGSQTLAAIRTEIEKRSGKVFVDPRTLAGFGGIPDLAVQPVGLWQLGGVILADFGTQYSHPDHANKLAGPLWRNVVVPWAADHDPGSGVPGGGGGVAPTEPSSYVNEEVDGGQDGIHARATWSPWAAFGLAAALGFGAGWWAKRS